MEQNARKKSKNKQSHLSASAKVDCENTVPKSGFAKPKVFLVPELSGCSHKPRIATALVAPNGKSREWKKDIRFATESTHQSVKKINNAICWIVATARLHQEIKKGSQSNVRVVFSWICTDSKSSNPLLSFRFDQTRVRWSRDGQTQSLKVEDRVVSWGHRPLHGLITRVPLGMAHLLEQQQLENRETCSRRNRLVHNKLQR